MQAPGSTLAFATEYDGEVFSGHFSRFTTTVSFDPQHPEAARLDVVIPLASAGTANPDRDQTLLGADFFNVGKFPQDRIIVDEQDRRRLIEHVRKSPRRRTA